MLHNFFKQPSCRQDIYYKHFKANQFKVKLNCYKEQVFFYSRGHGLHLLAVNLSGYRWY